MTEGATGATAIAGDIADIAGSREFIDDLAFRRNINAIEQFANAPLEALMTGTAMPQDDVAGDSRLAHEAQDRKREDAKLALMLNEAESNRIMWRAMFTYTQSQLRRVDEARDREMAAVRRNNLISGAIGFAGLVVAILALIFGK